jgi:hypothetical protein
MEVRHMPAAFAHSSWFVLRHGLEMLAHTFTGTTLRSVLGLETEKSVFERYRQLRRDERDYVQLPPAPAPMTVAPPPGRMPDGASRATV